MAKFNSILLLLLVIVVCSLFSAHRCNPDTIDGHEVVDPKSSAANKGEKLFIRLCVKASCYAGEVASSGAPDILCWCCPRTGLCYDEKTICWDNCPAPPAPSRAP